MSSFFVSVNVYYFVLLGGEFYRDIIGVIKYVMGWGKENKVKPAIVLDDDPMEAWRSVSIALAVMGGVPVKHFSCVEEWRDKGFGPFVKENLRAEPDMYSEEQLVAYLKEMTAISVDNDFSEASPRGPMYGWIEGLSFVGNNLIPALRRIRLSERPLVSLSTSSWGIIGRESGSLGEKGVVVYSGLQEAPLIGLALWIKKKYGVIFPRELMLRVLGYETDSRELLGFNAPHLRNMVFINGYLEELYKEGKYKEGKNLTDDEVLRVFGESFSVDPEALKGKIEGVVGLVGIEGVGSRLPRA